MPKKQRIILLTVSSAILTAVFCVIFYIFILPCVFNSKIVINSAKKIVKRELNADLYIGNINLKTHIKPLIELSIDNLSIKNGSEMWLNLDDFEFSVSFNKLLKRQIKLNKLKAKNLIVKADKFITSENQPQSEQKPFNYKIDFYNADIGLNKAEISYKQKNSIIDVKLKDVVLDCPENLEYKILNFNSETVISKNGKKYADIVASTKDEVKNFLDRLEIENLKVLINKSDLKLNAKIDLKNIFLTAQSKNFYLADIFSLINSDLIIENGEQMLSPLNNPHGSVSFNIDMKNQDLSGFITINNTRACIKDVSDIPLNIEKGKIEITKDKINFPDLIGYWGKNKNNKIKIYGDIKDYYKTFDSNITVDTRVSNEFFKDYLSKLIGGTVLHISKPSGTRIIYKAKNNIMDIIWLAKISKGTNFGIDDSKSALSDYDRAVKGDFHIEGDNLEIRDINYYIAPDIRKGVKLQPIIVLDSKMNLSGKIDNLGVKFARKMPCEILNVIAGKGTFKKGTIEGGIKFIFKNDIPYLFADAKIENTFVPSQRLRIKSLDLTTKNDIINIALDGGFKRMKYDFDAQIKNEMKPPFIINKMSLNFDEIDVEKFLASMNNQNNEQLKTAKVDENTDDDYMFDTSLIQIKDCDFYLKHGKYKELEFGNIKADLSLDDKGILNIQSNKFDIAQGISTLKVNCDLKKLKYYIRLGVKDVDSNLMAKVLLNLDKEISGKAKGLIELNSDESLKMNGQIKFLVEDGTIGKIGLVEYILKIASVFRNPIVMVNPTTIMDIVSIPEGKFEKISGEMKLRDNVVERINIQSYSKSLSALIRGRFDMDRHDASLRIYTRFSTDKNSMFEFLRNISLNTLANKVQMNTRNDANYYESELKDLPPIDVPEQKAQIFLTQVEGDVEHNNFISSLKKIK